ncbi:hypothetical protein BGV46_08095 [Serratia marcescens]|nr:hypothetical protein BGV45_08105 [Serratia marcescens]OHT37219.1 hypothetical protein BGV46_08095 [Serratia marcescens]
MDLVLNLLTDRLQILEGQNARFGWILMGQILRHQILIPQILRHQILEGENLQQPEAFQR